MFVSPSHDDWNRLLPAAQFAYNNAWNESLQTTPFELNSGQQVRTPLGLGSAPVPAANAFIQRIQAPWQEQSSIYRRLKTVKRRLLTRIAETLSMRLASRSCFPRITSHSKTRAHENCGHVGSVPFPITERVGQVAYRLDLPPSLKIHPVFHVSLLQPYTPSGRVQPPPPPIKTEGNLEYKVDQILSHRGVRVRTNVFRTEYLVSWSGYGPEHDSWEPEAHLTNCQESIADYRTGQHQRSVEGLRQREELRRITKRLRNA